MTQGEQAPGGPVAHSLDEIKPYVLTASAVGVLGMPAEVVVPIVRRLRRQSGVSVGPGLTSLANGIVALGVVHHLRQRPDKRERLPRWTPITALVYLTASPAAAAGWKRGVIFRGRTPLWGAVFSPVGLLQGALVFVALYRARRSRPNQEM